MTVSQKLRRIVHAEMPSGAHRLAFIDFLRAVAILLVFVRHATEVFLPYGHGNRFVYAVGDKLNFGALGVTVFFAISGFLIPWSLYGERLAGSVRYVLSRVFRLYPAFLVSVVPSAAAHFWLSGRAFSWNQILLNFTMLPRLFGGEMANGAYWTLEVEAAFYLICLLLFVGGILSEVFVFAVITLVTFVIFQSSQQPFFDGLFNPVLTGPAYFFNMDIAVMCWGAVCRAWWNGERLNLATAAIFWSFTAFWVVYRPAVLLVASLQHQMDGIDTKIIAAFGLGLAIFLSAVIYGRLRHPVMLWVGRISYSFYLLHGVAIHLIRQELDKHPGLKGYHSGLYCLLALALSLVFAQISFDLFERPGIRLGRFVTRHALAQLAAFKARPRALARRPARFTGWLFSRVGADTARGPARTAGSGQALELHEQP